MTQTPSRHARMTSLVGTLLMAAVAGCLVAFSLVAQHAALQSPGAPAVRPVSPQEGSGAPIEVAPFAGSVADQSPAPGASFDEQIDELLARADQPMPTARRDPSAGASSLGTPDVGRDNFPGRPPLLPQEGPSDPERCEEGRCHGPRPRVPTAAGDGDGDEDEETCRGKGHLKHADRHKGRGKGHCEHEGEVAPASPGHPGDPGSAHGKPDHAGPPASDNGNSDKAKAPQEKSDPPAKGNGQGHEKAQGPPAKESHGKPPKTEPPGQAKKEKPSSSGKSSAPGQSKNKRGSGKSK